MATRAPVAGAQLQRLADRAFALARRARGAHRSREAAAATRLGCAARFLAEAELELSWRQKRITRAILGLSKRSSTRAYTSLDTTANGSIDIVDVGRRKGHVSLVDR